jgi:hypothetical protein
MTKQLSNFLSILVIVLGFSSCCGTRMATCPDGRPVSFPKSERCAAKIYQDAVKDFNANLKATVNVVDKVTVGVDKLEIKNESKLLKEKLDQESIRLQETLKSSYLAITRDPCANSERHYKLVESVNSYNYKLQELKTKLENETKEAEIEGTFNNYLYQRGKQDGQSMGQLTKMIDNYFQANKKYPTTLDEISANDLILQLGASRLEYKLIKDNEYTLRFAGEDYMLGSSDDKIHKGIDGKTERIQ